MPKVELRESSSFGKRGRHSTEKRGPVLGARYTEKVFLVETNKKKRKTCLLKRKRPTPPQNERDGTLTRKKAFLRS